jgi:hypothetical protein
MVADTSTVAPTGAGDALKSITAFTFQMGPGRRIGT